MNNKKLSRLLEPNLKLYFLFLVIFTVAAVPISPLLALVEGVATAALYAYFRSRNQKRRQNIMQYIDNVTGSVDTASKSTLINSPLPIMVFRPDTGEVIWSNENFLQLAGVREHLFEMRVEDAVPHFPVQWLLERKQECPGQGPGRGAEPGGHHLLGGHHRGRPPPRRLHRHPPGAGDFDAGQLRGFDEGLRRHGAQRHPGPD